MKKTFTAGGVVLNEKGEVLVVNQRGNSWSLPKGHIDPGEDDLTAAKREIAEESGITELDYIKPLGTYERFRIGKHGGDDTSESARRFAAAAAFAAAIESARRCVAPLSATSTAAGTGAGSGALRQASRPPAARSTRAASTTARPVMRFSGVLDTEGDAGTISWT